MRVAAVLAAVLAFFAGMWVLRQYQKHVPPLERDPEWSFERDYGDVTAEFMDGTGRTYTIRGRLVTEDEDGVQPVDPRLAEAADRLARSPLTVELSTGPYIAVADAVAILEDT